MAINLTAGAIDMICNGNTEIKPFLQVMEIRVVNTSNQNSGNERFRMLVSDGVHTQQGMLATQRNDLVHSNKLQKGSIVQLQQFACSLIQNRKIIIIIELDVIQEGCDPIGQPTSYMSPGVARPAQVQSHADQAKAINGNLQYGNTQSSGVSSIVNPNSAGGRSLQPPQIERRPEMQPSSTSLYANNSSTERFSSTNPPVYPGSNTAGAFNNFNTEVRPSTIRPIHQQPPPIYMNRGPIARNEAAPRIIPIAALNPYQGRWTIKARVTAKTELRQYTNARGEGKVFSFDLLDSDGGEIRVTCFNAVADQFFSQIEVGRVYFISKGSLKPAQKAFNHLANDYEMMLDATSSIQPCFDDDRSIPRQQFNFRPICDVEGMESGSIVDIIGVVSSVNPTTTIMKKDGTETQKRTLQLKDQSGKSVELTLWGKLCNAQGHDLQTLCDSGQFPVLAVKAGRVNEFNGKSVGTVQSSQLFIEPDFPETRPLKEWFDREGKKTPFLSISKEGVSRTEVRKTISQIKDEKLGTSEKPDYITVSAHIIFIRFENFCYTACPLMFGERQCAKKVTNNGDGKWRCDRCDQLVDECDYRYILQCQIQDHTGLTWVTAFQECGEEIMGVSAKELHYLKYEEQDDDKFNETVYPILFTKYTFKLKVKEETFSDEQRIKSTVMKADKLNFSSETRFLVDLMTKQLTPEAANTNGQQPTASGAQYGDPRYQMGNVSGMSGNPYASCSSCGGGGHSAANCPSVMSGPGHLTSSYVNRTTPGPVPGGGGGASGGECYKCHQTGHWARDCPGSSAVGQYGSSAVGQYGSSAVGQYGSSAGGANGECYKCHQPGHWARDCPGSSAVAQSGPAGGGDGGGGGSSGGQCYKCQQFGHWARDCPGISSVPPAYGMQRQHIGGGY